MKKYSKIILTSLIAIGLMSGNALAMSFDNNITIYDGQSDYSDYNHWTTWYGSQEDQEVEYPSTVSQDFDMEAFYWNVTNSELTMVGGYDLFGGYYDESYDDNHIDSGDIFIDTNGDTSYYEYVLDMDFSAKTYSVYAIDESALLLDPKFVLQTGAWRYESGGTLISDNNAMSYAENLTDDEVGGLLGGYHYAVGVDLSFLPAGTQFISHFTMECGNDDLLGQGMAPVPEPATMLLFGTGIMGLAGYSKKRRKA
jgi:hypothetical protein